MVVKRRDGARSTAADFSYEELSVSRVEPPYLLAGVGNASVSVFGSDLAASPADIASLQIGGYRCESMLVVGTEELVCNLTHVDEWATSEVHVTTRFGRSYEFEGIFTGVNAPVVLYVEPPVAAAGAEVILSGRDFTHSGSSNP